jgi:signal recognition particle GTPase
MGPPPVPGLSQSSRFARPITAGAVLSSFQKLSSNSLDNPAARRLTEGSSSFGPSTYSLRIPPQSRTHQDLNGQPEKQTGVEAPAHPRSTPEVFSDMPQQGEKVESQCVGSDEDDESGIGRSQDIGDALRAVLKHFSVLESFPGRIDQRMSEMQQAVESKVHIADLSEAILSKCTYTHPKLITFVPISLFHSQASEIKELVSKNKENDQDLDEASSALTEYEKVERQLRAQCEKLEAALSATEVELDDANDLVKSLRDDAMKDSENRKNSICNPYFLNRYVLGM